MHFPSLLKSTAVSVLIAVSTLVFSANASVLAFRNVSEGQSAPPFTLKDASGKDASLSEGSGKVTVVVFIRPDQKQSQEAVADLERIYKKYGQKGVNIIGVMPEMDQQDQLKQLIGKEQITFPIVLDPDRKVYGQWGAFLYPTTGIIDKSGKMAVHVPSHNWKYGDVVEQNVRVLIGEISKEQMDAILNPKEKEKLTDGQKNAERHMMLAQKLVERKMLDKAAAEYSEAVNDDPNLVQARINYGFLLLRMGDAAKAQENFQKAIELNPKAEEARTGLGAALVQQGSVDKGIEMLTEALKLNPRPARTHFELGKAYEKKGALDKAVLNYRKAAELSSDW